MADRIAQMGVRIKFEEKVEPFFLEDSYEYRPNKSAHNVLEITMTRCWKYDWVLEFDIKGLFDNINHDLLMKAVRKHTGCPWDLLYIELWLTVPVESNGKNQRCSQGVVISPVLSNLFLHYAFNKWMEKEFQSNPRCRYSDDGIIHCKSQN